MSERKRLKSDFDVLTKENFSAYALQVFQFQSKHNTIYKKYIDALNINPKAVKQLEKIPFMPISFFKNHLVSTVNDQNNKFEAVFESSGTGQGLVSKHYVTDLNFYLFNSKRIFEATYGHLKDFVILALLPSYLERGNSSLIAMVNFFIKETENEASGFYLNEYELLIHQVAKIRSEQVNKKIIVWGVSFALLDLAEKFQPDFSSCIVMETGGMKGRRQEITREALHAIFCDAFKLDSVHSEYGMTELLSQSYSKGEGVFIPAHSMSVLSREINDPFDIQLVSKRVGGLNVIDLANIDSCAFIETQDIGRVNEDGSFEVYGRLDHSAIRGCNLMVF